MTINLVSMCMQGYWECTRCDRVVLIAGDSETPVRCTRCKHNAEWRPPVFNEHEKITLGPKLVGITNSPRR